MIVRVWHGKTKSSEATQYREYVVRTGIPDYLRTPGNKGAQIWQQTDGDITHIWAVSWWDSYDSIKLFAGLNYALARYYDDDKKFLLELEENVVHYEAFNLF